MLEKNNEKEKKKKREKRYRKPSQRSREADPTTFDKRTV